MVDDLERCLDVVALGTLADMMPVQNENRILVRHGLRRMASSPRPGLRALLERKRLLGKDLDSRDVGWSLSPLINASGRMGEPDKAVELLLTGDPGERDTLADYVVELNERRRQVGEEAWLAVQEQAKESYDAHDGRFILVHNDSIHRGVTGIVAGRLARRYDAPAAVVCVMPDRAVGSVRTARGLVATDLLSRCSDLLEVVPLMEMEEQTEKQIDIDAELPAGFLSPTLLEVVSLFGPYGQENQPLVFLARNLRLDDITFMGKEQKHLKLLVSSGAHRWPAVFWNAADHAGAGLRKGARFDAVFNLGTNYYNGSETPRMTLLDVESADGDPSA